MKSQQQIKEKLSSLKTHLNGQELLLEGFLKKKKPIKEYATRQEAKLSRDHITVTGKVIETIKHDIKNIDWVLSDGTIV